MAINETGHNVNVANLNKLNEVIITFGSNYNPAKAAIKLSALQALYDDGKAQISKVQNSKNNYSTKVDEREIAFKEVKTFSTRIIAGLSGTNVSKEIIKDAKSINAKIQAKKIDNPNTKTENETPTTENETPQEEDINNDPTSKKHSISRQSHVSLHENFSDLVDLLKNSSGYDPNEPEFQPAQLETYKNALQKANENIDTAVVLVADKRIIRNEFLYNLDTGLVNTALDAKKYIQGLFGASSPQFKLADKIHFKNIK